MELVNVSLYAEGYYSGETYEENIWIKKSSYEKLKDDFPEKIGCGELDGKYSNVSGDVEVEDEWETDDDYARAVMPQNDGNILKYKLADLYEENGLDWVTEQKEIKEYFDGLDKWVVVSVKIPSSKKDELLKYVDKICKE